MNTQWHDEEIQRKNKHVTATKPGPCKKKERKTKWPDARTHGKNSAAPKKLISFNSPEKHYKKKNVNTKPGPCKKTKNAKHHGLMYGHKPKTQRRKQKPHTFFDTPNNTPQNKNAMARRRNKKEPQERDRAPKTRSM